MPRVPPEGKALILGQTPRKDRVYAQAFSSRPRRGHGSGFPPRRVREQQLRRSGASSSGGAAPYVGVILPDTASSARWETNDRPYLEAAFKAAGVEYDIQNAQGDKAEVRRPSPTDDQRAASTS